MKITPEKTKAQVLKPPSSDLPSKSIFRQETPRRRIKNPGTGVRMKRYTGGPSAKGFGRPDTPLLRWKFDEVSRKNSAIDDGKSSVEVGREILRKMKSMESSSRKLGAGMWRLHSPEVKNGGVRRFGFQCEGGHFANPICGHYQDRFELPFKPSNAAMEGVTKWDPVGSKESDEFNRFLAKSNLYNKSTLATVLEKDLERAKSRINELETERRSSKKKLEQFLRKLGEERVSWKSREHEKIRLFIDDVKSELTKEKKNRQRLEVVNSKMVNELADAKVLTKRYVKEFEKERKTREMIEEVCDKLAKEMGEDKSELESLKREYGKLHDEVEEERKMLQVAEVWREERVQMKLVDAKVMLEEKYSYMNRLVEELKSFLNSTSAKSDTVDIKKAEFLCQVAASVDLQDVRELKYEPPNPDDIFSIFGDRNFSETNEEDIEPCDDEQSPMSHVPKVHTVSPKVKLLKKDKAQRHFDAYTDRSVELEEDSTEANLYRTRQSKMGSSVSKIGRSQRKNHEDHYEIIPIEGKKGKALNGRHSNGSVLLSSDIVSGKGEDLSIRWSSSDSGNLHIDTVIEESIERSQIAQKSSLKARLLEARLENQKLKADNLAMKTG